MASCHDKLMEQGVTIITNNRIIEQLPELHNEFMQTVRSFPEFTTPHKMNEFVMGGFGALGNPASFHNPLVRKLREWCLSIVVDFFKDLLRTDNAMHLEMLVDRMLYRPTGATVSKDSWHRDTPLASQPLDALAEEDMVFGGWINLDTAHSQPFEYVAGTHMGSGSNHHTGFTTIDKKYHKELDAKSSTIMVPPGGIIIFFERILHKVSGGKAKHDMTRLFIGWRLTKSTTAMFPDTAKQLDDQGIVNLKSGQVPPMYATLHWTNWRNKLVEWSKFVHPSSTELREVKSGKSKGEVHRVCVRHMRSLKALNMPLFKRYSQREHRLYQPCRRWPRLLVAGYTTLRRTVEFTDN